VATPEDTRLGGRLKEEVEGDQKKPLLRGEKRVVEKLSAVRGGFVTNKGKKGKKCKKGNPKTPSEDDDKEFL